MRGPDPKPSRRTGRSAYGNRTRLAALKERQPHQKSKAPWRGADVSNASPVAGATGFQPALGTSRDHSPKRAAVSIRAPEGAPRVQSAVLGRQLALCTRPRTRTLQGWFWRPARTLYVAQSGTTGSRTRIPTLPRWCLPVGRWPRSGSGGSRTRVSSVRGMDSPAELRPRSGPCGDRTRRESLAKRLCALATRPVVGVTGIGPAYTCAQDRWVTTTLHPVGVSDRSRTGLAQVHSLRAPLFALAHRTVPRPRFGRGPFGSKPKMLPLHYRGSICSLALVRTRID